MKNILNIYILKKKIYIYVRQKKKIAEFSQTPYLSLAVHMTNDIFKFVPGVCSLVSFYSAVVAFKDLYSTL